MSDQDFEIDVSSSKEQATFLAQFSNGKLKCAEAVSFGLLEHESVSSKGKRKRTLVAESQEMTYLGHNDGLYAPAPGKHCKYMVGVLNKKRGKMKVYDTEMFLLRPSSIVDQEEKEDTRKGDDKEISFMQKNDDLTSAFGSSKRKKAMNSRIKNKLKEDVLEEAVGSAVQHAMAAPDVETKLATPKSEAAPLNIPPFDINAKKSEDVYKLSDIIGKDEMLALQVPAKNMFVADATTISEWKETEEYPLFILQQLSVLPIQEDARMQKACHLTYLLHMIKLYHMRSAQLRSKESFGKDIQMPNIVKRSLFDKFTILASNTRCMPARLKDKLLSYILVLCLILDEFSLDTAPLQQDLRIGDTKLSSFLRALGCRTKKENVQLISGLTTKMTTATLPVPLTFPELREKKGKARR